ncbi:hypothetical protein BaRGS_00017420, partial [Batillaria attramentaria]
DRSGNKKTCVKRPVTVTHITTDAQTVRRGMKRDIAALGVSVQRGGTPGMFFADR